MTTNPFHRCPITYQELRSDALYSPEGLRKLSPRLHGLKPLPLSAEQQRLEALQRAPKMSIQGVQIKLSARLETKKGQMEIVDSGGKFILKPQHEIYPNLPENEDLTLHLAETMGIETPLHGLLFSRDGSLTYFIKRFDRYSHKQKLPVEDFAQLLGYSRETKYDSSMEEMSSVIERFCTFPVIEKEKLLIRCLFNFLVGNEDMHLKNFSLITRDDKVELAPAYDFLNTAIVMGGDAEEIALPLRGKKNKLKREDWIEYFAQQRLHLNKKIVQGHLERFAETQPIWRSWIEKSFLPEVRKLEYLHIIQNRSSQLF